MYTLSTIQKCHIESIRQWRNNQKQILRQTSNISVLEQEEWYNNLHKDKSQELFAICYNDVLIGYCGLTNINYIYRTTELSYVLDDNKYFTTNYKDSFKFVIQRMKKLAFSTLNLYKIYTETYAFRKTHILYLEECGFVQEGVLKKHVYIDGERVDSIIHGMLNE